MKKLLLATLLFLLCFTVQAQTFVCTDVSFPNGTGGASAYWEQNFLKSTLGSTESIIVYDNNINFSNNIFKKMSESLYECKHEDGTFSRLTITGRSHTNERYLITSFKVRYYADKRGDGFILTYKLKLN